MDHGTYLELLTFDVVDTTQFVVAAGLSFIANFFLRAHQLSDKADGAVLGVDRGKKVEHQPNPSNTRMMQTIELRRLPGKTA
jgi:hypothetical protein